MTNKIPLLNKHSRDKSRIVCADVNPADMTDGLTPYRSTFACVWPPFHAILQSTIARCPRFSWVGLERQRRWRWNHARVWGRSKLNKWMITTKKRCRDCFRSPLRNYNMTYNFTPTTSATRCLPYTVKNTCLVRLLLPVLWLCRNAL